MEKEELEKMIESGMSSRDMTRETGKSQTSISYWLKKWGLKTSPKLYSTEYNCKHCGEKNPDNFYGHYKGTCKKCFNKTQTNKFREVRRLIVLENGGECKICGYSKYIGALEFHHLDPSKKDLSYQSSKCWSIERIRKEVSGCVLLCSNCHREIEAGITELPNCISR